ncbi:MAG TPA: hypothetical protein VLY23_13385 [Candidatus Acidoferrum sp.]|nr:hypothetical protein [Candidatus Acidoferrum sp.]
MRKLFFGVASLILTMCVPAAADIVSGSVTGGSALAAGGTFVKLTPPLSNPFGPPDSVGSDNFQSPDLFGFDEDQNITLVAPLTVDVGASPIAAGTVVSSYYIFFDPGPAEQVIGTVNFDSDVLAIITSTGGLASTDFLANTGVNYLNPTLRGLEAGDSVTISGPQQILFDTVASSPGDYVRVLTAASPGVAAPEPRSVAFLAMGLIWLSTSFRRKTSSSKSGC